LCLGFAWQASTPNGSVEQSGLRAAGAQVYRADGISLWSANFAKARCENIIKIDLGTHNFQQFLATNNQHYGMRCSSYTGGKRTAPTVVSAGRPDSRQAWQPINMAARSLTTFIMAKVAACSQYAVCIAFV
jgi:hypothetical protein